MAFSGRKMPTSPWMSMAFMGMSMVFQWFQGYTLETRLSTLLPGGFL